MIGATPPSSICTGANRLPGKGAGGRGSLRLLPGKALFLRREAQTFHPEKRRRLREFAPPSRESLISPSRGANISPGKAPAAAGVCAPFPGKPYFSVEGRKLFAGKRRRRPWEFAPHSRERLILPLRGANLSPGKAPAAAGVCASLPGKPYSSVEGRKPFTRKSPGGCGSLRLPPGKACYEVTVEGRKPCTRKRCRRLCEFAPNSPERLILPLRGANPAPENPPGAFSEGLRRTPRRRRRRTAGCSRR